VNRCGAPVSAPHSSVFARLASGAFYETIVPVTFYEIINFDGLVKRPSILLGAGLRFNPALLDKNPRLGYRDEALEIRMGKPS
jgi:hypothetical protein